MVCYEKPLEIALQLRLGAANGDNVTDEPVEVQVLGEYVEYTSSK